MGGHSFCTETADSGFPLASRFDYPINIPMIITGRFVTDSPIPCVFEFKIPPILFVNQTPVIATGVVDQVARATAKTAGAKFGDDPTRFHRIG